MDYNVSENDVNSYQQQQHHPFLQPLSLNELKKGATHFSTTNEQADENMKCLLCDQKFNLLDNKKQFLAHLILSHRLVISDVDNIAEFSSYIKYWHERLQTGRLEDFCFKITTNSLPSDRGVQEDYFLLSDSLPEEKSLRERLKYFKLEEALKQQEKERLDQSYYRECLFCSQMIGNNRSNILNHMLFEHNFNIGLADNLVYFDEFYQKLVDRFEGLKCFYCEKVFYDKSVLKEHMRKKQHKCINPQNKEFDKYYMINYLETGKDWQDIKSERDEMDVENAGLQIEDWDDNFQVYYCLFCDQSYENESGILGHLINSHHFDLKSKIKTNNLSFYSQIKLINYIRRQVYTSTCFICKKQLDSKESLVAHLHENDHIDEFPCIEYYDQPEYLFSTFEDDSLLCLLDDSSYSKDEEKIKVIPEQYVCDLDVNEELIQNFKEIL